VHIWKDGKLFSVEIDREIYGR